METLTEKSEFILAVEISEGDGLGPHPHADDEGWSLRTSLLNNLE